MAQTWQYPTASHTAFVKDMKPTKLPIFIVLIVGGGSGSFSFYVTVMLITVVPINTCGDSQSLIAATAALCNHRVNYSCNCKAFQVGVQLDAKQNR